MVFNNIAMMVKTSRQITANYNWKPCTMVFKTLMLFGLVFSFYNCTHTQAQNQVLDPLAFKQALENTPNPFILDVRSSEEFKGGHLEGAFNLDWNASEFETQAAQWNRNTPVFIYCLSGGRSSAAAQRLRKMKFVSVVELNGGLLAWRSEALPEKGFIKKSGLSKKTFQDSLRGLQDSVLVDFFAEWCKPCQRMKPALKNIQNRFNTKMSLWRIDADRETELCKQLSIDALPVLQLYVKGIKVWEHRGYISEEAICSELNLH